MRIGALLALQSSPSPAAFGIIIEGMSFFKILGGNHLEVIVCAWAR